MSLPPLTPFTPTLGTCCLASFISCMLMLISFWWKERLSESANWGLFTPALALTREDSFCRWTSCEAQRVKVSTDCKDAQSHTCMHTLEMHTDKVMLKQKHRRGSRQLIKAYLFLIHTVFLFLKSCCIFLCCTKNEVFFKQATATSHA